MLVLIATLAMAVAQPVDSPDGVTASGSSAAASQNQADRTASNQEDTAETTSDRPATRRVCRSVSVPDRAARQRVCRDVPIESPDGDDDQED